MARTVVDLFADGVAAGDPDVHPNRAARRRRCKPVLLGPGKTTTSRNAHVPTYPEEYRRKLVGENPARDARAPSPHSPDQALSPDCRTALLSGSNGSRDTRFVKEA